MNAVAPLPFWVELLCAAMLVVGGVFTLVGAIGMLRFRDFYMRLHAPTKAATLGVGGVLVASIVAAWGRDDFGLHEVLVTLFMAVTAPVSAALLAQAALHQRLPSEAALPPDLPLD